MVARHHFFKRPSKFTIALQRLFLSTQTTQLYRGSPTMLPIVIKVHPDSSQSLMSMITHDDESHDFSRNVPSSRSIEDSTRAKVGLWLSTMPLPKPERRSSTGTNQSMKNESFAPIRIDRVQRFVPSEIFKNITPPSLPQRQQTRGSKE